MSIENRSDAAEIRAAASVLLERMQFLKQAGITFQGKRDLYEIFGYDRILTNKNYRDRYARGGIAKRIVEALPKATWRGGIELIEDENPKVSTEFEKLWETLEARLHIWSTLMRADILAGLGAYSVVLIGADGPLDTELSKGKGPDSLLYLTPFSGGGGPQFQSRTNNTATMDADASIMSLVTDPSNERFGLPEFYQLKRLDINAPEFQVPVHWSRVIHIAEGCLDDEVYGQPTLENCWNLLDDLDKVTGGGAEAFWLRANQGLQLDVDKDLTLETSEKQALKDQADEYANQMRRMLRTRGVTVTPLGSDVANFLAPADAIITQIAGSKGIPKRILTGSEMGELASSQDRDNWKDQVNGRQSGYAGPNIVRPLIDRLIKYNYLPKPKEYEVKWAQIQVLTDQEKSAGALEWAQTLTSEGPVFLRDEIRDHWYGMEPLPKPKIDEATGDHTSPNKNLPLAPVTDHVTGMPIKQPNPPILGNHPVTGLPVEVDTKSGKPAAQNKKPLLTFKKRAAETHSFSSTQVNLPPELARPMVSFANSIDNDALTPEGIEYTPHVTVKYGVHTNDVEEVRALLEGSGPITVTLGPIDVFQTPGHDVLIVRIESSDLVRLNAEIASRLEVTDTYPTYEPHATLAYLWPGQAKPWIGDRRFVGLTATIDTVIFSTADDIVTPIPLLPYQRSASQFTQEAEDELVEVLRAAIESNSTDIIDRIIGTTRALGFNPSEPRDKNGMWTSGGVNLVDRDGPLYPKKSQHWAESASDQVWQLVSTGEDTNTIKTRFTHAFEHIHGTLSKPKGSSVLAALTGFADIGQFIGLSEDNE